MKWKDGLVTKATISSKTGGTTTLRYNGKQKKVKVKKGKRVTITSNP
jgi:alpha-L-fucosidase 2